MNVYKSDSLEWTDEDEEATAKKISEMLTSSKSKIQKHRDGTCDVYEVTMGEEKATIVDASGGEKEGIWRVYAGKFRKEGIGPFVDGSGFDKNFNNGKGIKLAVNEKITKQQDLQSAMVGRLRGNSK